MRAIVITRPGGPEVLQIAERPTPVATPGQVLIRVRGFGLNHAEIYFRSGLWGDVAEISGIECVGTVVSDASGRFLAGETVFAIVGGMGRTLNGSYAEYTVVPASNVVAIKTTLTWERLATIPESYATAWTCLFVNLALQSGHTVLVRGATSSLGQAAINLAAHAGATVIATTRRAERIAGLKAIGAKHVLLETGSLRNEIFGLNSRGIDAVLDLIGNSTILDSLALLRRDGRACLAGFLDGGGPLNDLQPVFQIPSGRHLSVFASALVTGSPEFPIDEIPFQEIVDRVASDVYQSKPSKIFDFNEVREAHVFMEAGSANGKIVVLA